mgnify:CR=1 FL=1
MILLPLIVTTFIIFGYLFIFREFFTKVINFKGEEEDG